MDSDSLADPVELPTALDVALAIENRPIDRLPPSGSAAPGVSDRIATATGGPTIPSTTRATVVGVALVVAVHTAILIAASSPFVLLDWPPRTGWWGFPSNVWPLAL